MKRRYSVKVAARDALRIELLDVLLDDHKTSAEIDALKAAGISYDVFYEFDFTIGQIAALRLAHRDLLRDEARKRGLPSTHVD